MEFHWEQSCLYSLTAAGRNDLRHLQTLRGNQSVAEGAAQCCDGVLQVGDWLSSVPPHPQSQTSQDRAGPPHQSVQSLPVSSWNAAAPANYSKEDGRCHHRHKKSSGAPPVVQKTSVCSGQGTGMISPVQFIVQLNTQVLIRSPVWYSLRNRRKTWVTVT